MLNRDFLLAHLPDMFEFYASGSYKTGTQVLQPDEFDIHCVLKGTSVNCNALDLKNPADCVGLSLCYTTTGAILLAKDFQNKLYQALTKSTLKSITSVKRKSSCVVVKVQRYYGLVSYDLLPSLPVAGIQGCFVVPDGDSWMISFPKKDFERVNDMER